MTAEVEYKEQTPRSVAVSFFLHTDVCPELLFRPSCYLFQGLSIFDRTTTFGLVILILSNLHYALYP